MEIRYAKTCFTTCRAANRAAAHALCANACAAADTATRDPAPAVTPSDTTSYKNAGGRVRPSGRTERNNPAGHTSARKNLDLPTLGADPRVSPLRQLTPASSAASAVAADNAGSAYVGLHGRCRWRDTAGSPLLAANAAPLPHNGHYSTGFVAMVGQTIVHSP
jgi:hypothetical protein